MAHYKKEDPDTGLETKEILLSQPAKGQTYLDQLSACLHKKDDRESGSRFKKIELFWPHELLEVRYDFRLKNPRRISARVRNSVSLLQMF